MDRIAWPSFDESMKFSYDYNTSRIRDDKWDIIRTRYNSIKDQKVGEDKIPKIVHQIWLGRAMPSLEQELTAQVKNRLLS